MQTTQMALAVTRAAAKSLRLERPQAVESFTLPAAAAVPHSEYLTVSPALARAMLARNAHPHQRAVIRSSINTWVQRFQNGDWLTTHQGLAFGADGLLYDGQHRLTALSLLPDHVGGRPFSVVMQVTFNLPPNAFMGIDQGKVRSNAVALGESPDIVGVARSIATLYRGSSVGITPQVLAPFIDMVRHNYEWLIKRCGNKRRYWSNAMKKSAAIYWMLKSPSHAEAIVAAYEALVRQDFFAMTPVVLSAAKQENEGHMTKQFGQDQFAKLTRIFDPANAHSTKLLSVKQPEIYTEDLRAVCRQHLPQSAR